MSQTTDSIDLTDIAGTQQALLAAVLDHVLFDGWSLAAIDNAARDLAIPPAIARDLFENTPINAIALHSRNADLALLEALEADPEFAGMKVREKIKCAIQTRLTNAAGDREAIRRAMALLSLPQNTPLATKLLWETCDAIWLAAGDRATDYNRYTKRGLLAGVYSSTLLVWLDDQSEDFSKTWAFLDARIGNVLKIFGAIGSLAKRFSASNQR